MRILYVAMLDGSDNDPEGEIARCLTLLGHQVYRVHEPLARATLRSKRPEMDLLLFHKWPDPKLIHSVNARKKVFWFFDCVSSQDPTLARWMTYRRNWMESVLQFCTKGFLTDGDWVAADKTGKLVHLLQGADERTAGPGTPIPGAPPILFTGMVNHGVKRANFIRRLQDRYGNLFEVFGDGGPRRRVHGRRLADLLAGRIIIAPDGPQTDRYWSNRVYQALGFQAFLLHPYCDGLDRQYGYEVGDPIILGVPLDQQKERRDSALSRGFCFYGNFESCCELIDYYLDRPELRQQIAEVGYKRTMAEHTYMHRVQELLQRIDHD